MKHSSVCSDEEDLIVTRAATATGTLLDGRLDMTVASNGFEPGTLNERML